MRKYQVGDKVVMEESLSLLFNSYHKEATFKLALIYTVMEATDEYFSLYKPKDYKGSPIQQGLTYGVYEYLVRHQEDGRKLGRNPKGNRGRALHLDKDKELIKSKLEMHHNRVLKTETDRVESKVRQLENELENKKNSLQEDLDKYMQIFK